MSRYQELEEAIELYGGERLTAGALVAFLSTVPADTPVCFSAGTEEPRMEAISPPYPDDGEDFLWIDIGALP